MPDYTLRVRRYDPESGGSPYWQDYEVTMPDNQSVLNGILEVRDHHDGTLGIRCSCRQAICGSCGVRINGRPMLACNTHLEKAQASVRGADGAIVVEPMGNMPVIKDLIVDMDAVHWEKIHRVTPWLLPEGDPPEREYIVPHQSMVDITQSMACIQCGACVSDCLSMEVDPDFVGPAALAKAYRFVGDPRDGEHAERLTDLAQDPHGIYDCTHCFNCIQACPKDVAPMSQIMRLRRIAGSDYAINDRNNGHRHEQSFVGLVTDYGLLQEAELLPRSYGGNSWFAKFTPPAAAELGRSLPSIVKAVLHGKVSPTYAMRGHKIPDHQRIREIYDSIESKDSRYELNLYISGVEDEPEPAPASATEGGQEHATSAATGSQNQ